MKTRTYVIFAALALALAGCGGSKETQDDSVNTGGDGEGQSAEDGDDGATDSSGGPAATSADGSGTTGAATGTATGTTTGTSTGSTLAAGGTTASRAAEPNAMEEADGVVDEDDPAVEPPAEEEVTGANPFVITEHDPLSTFAADVNTASYDQFRQYMAAGSLPPAEGVRLEEYVNYFAYDYPAPAADSEIPFSISLAAAPTIMDRDTVLLRVGIQGKLPPEQEKNPTNLVFLIDVSGSMTSEDKLPLVQHTLRETLNVLDPSDTVSIVSYASDTRVRLEPTPVSDSVTLEAEIEGLAAGGSTAGAAGLDLAYEQAEAGFIEGGINHIVLCTDGDFNVGPSSTADLVALIEEKRETGITLTALGYGMNNDPMMEAVSNAGNGVYGLITDEDQATKYVHERMLATLVHIAKDMKLQVEFNPDEVHAYRLLGYENRAIADEQFRDDLVDAGEIGAGHRVTALYEVVLVGNEIPAAEGAPAVDDGEAYAGEVEVAAEDLVLVKIRYKEPGAAAEDPASEVAQSLAASAVAESYTALDADFQWAIGIASFAEILRGSPYADAANLSVIQTIVERPVHADDPDKAEFARLLVEQALPLLEQ